MADVVEAVPKDAVKGFPLLWMHADAEPVLPFEEAVRGRARLAELGLAVESFDFKGGGADISPEAAAHLKAWLEALISRPGNSDKESRT